ncbi:hypothetical protein HKX48_002282 [Thoreauomyces humboldtii]|nr:hypothetical protein HKX48_002282 [Thoreauomyces humboldtii]
MLLTLLAAGASTAAAASQTVSIPWREFHQSFVGAKGAYFVGGNTNEAWNLQIAPNADGAFAPAGSIQLLVAKDATVHTMAATFPSLIGHSCAVRPSTNVAYCSGGFLASHGPAPVQAESTLVMYDTEADSISTTSSPSVPGRAFHASAFVGDALYLFGGIDCLNCPITTGYTGSQTVRYDPTTNASTTFATVGTPSPVELAGTCAVSLADNTVLLIGGARMNPAIGPSPVQLWKFDPSNANQSFVAVTTSGTGPKPQWGASCALGPDGLVYVQGGCDPVPGSSSGDANMYTLDVKTSTWAIAPTSANAGPSARCFGAGAMVNGFFVVHGGSSGTAAAAGLPNVVSSSAAAPQMTPETHAAPPAQPTPSPSAPIKPSPAADSSRPAQQPSSKPASPSTGKSPSTPNPSTGGTEGQGTSGSSGASSGTDGSDSRPSWWPEAIPYPPPGIDDIEGSLISNNRRSMVVRRQTVTSDDGTVYVFDTTTKGWMTAPTSLLASTAAGSVTPGSTIAGAATSSSAAPPDNSGRTHAIIAALFVSIITAASAFGIMIYYWWRKQDVRPSAKEMKERAKRSGLAKIFRVRRKKQKSPAENSSHGGSQADSKSSLLERHNTMHKIDARGMFLDPDRNVIIPLLAPIHVDDGRFDTTTGVLENRPLDPKNNRPSDLGPLAKNLDLENLRLDASDDPTTDGNSSLPRRKESVFRRKSRSPTTSAVPDASTTPPVTTGYVLDQPLHYQVVYPHVPSRQDEIELVPGDTIAVGKIYKDGWCRGTNLRSGLSGVFPLLAVEETDDYDHQRQPVSTAAHHHAPPPPTASSSSDPVFGGWWEEGGFYAGGGEGSFGSNDAQASASGYSGSEGYSSGGLFGTLLGSKDRGYGTVRDAASADKSEQEMVQPVPAPSPKGKEPAYGT